MWRFATQYINDPKINFISNKIISSKILDFKKLISTQT